VTLFSVTQATTPLDPTIAAVFEGYIMFRTKY